VISRTSCAFSGWPKGFFSKIAPFSFDQIECAFYSTLPLPHLPHRCSKLRLPRRTSPLLPCHLSRLYLPYHWNIESFLPYSIFRAFRTSTDGAFLITSGRTFSDQHLRDVLSLLPRPRLPDISSLRLPSSRSFLKTLAAPPHISRSRLPHNLTLRLPRIDTLYPSTCL
jgi:hypothetical protein